MKNIQILLLILCFSWVTPSHAAFPAPATNNTETRLITHNNKLHNRLTKLFKKENHTPSNHRGNGNSTDTSALALLLVLAGFFLINLKANAFFTFLIPIALLSAGGLLALHVINEGRKGQGFAWTAVVFAAIETISLLLVNKPH